MLKYISITAAVLTLVNISNASAVSLRGNDGRYLGELNSNQYDMNSVSNPYGPYGSKYSPTSINNPYSQYGSKHSMDSPNNPYALSNSLTSTRR